ncbi:MAG: hypothetical protein ACXVBE_11015 [Bdellovibrionota bacterium]
MFTVRQRAEKLRPEPGEVLQAIFFAYFTALERFKGTEELYNKKMPVPAFGLLIHGIEELGKISKLRDILIKWQEQEKTKNYEEKLKNHSWKINSAISFFREFIKRSSVNLSIKAAIIGRLISYDT